MGVLSGAPVIGGLVGDLREVAEEVEEVVFEVAEVEGVAALCMSPAIEDFLIFCSCANAIKAALESFLALSVRSETERSNRIARARGDLSDLLGESGGAFRVTRGWDEEVVAGEKVPFDRDIFFFNFTRFSSSLFAVSPVVVAVADFLEFEEDLGLVGSFFSSRIFAHPCNSSSLSRCPSSSTSVGVVLVVGVVPLSLASPVFVALSLTSGTGVSPLPFRDPGSVAFLPCCSLAFSFFDRVFVFLALLFEEDFLDESSRTFLSARMFSHPAKSFSLMLTSGKGASSVFGVVGVFFSS